MSSKRIPEQLFNGSRFEPSFDYDSPIWVTLPAPRLLLQDDAPLMEFIKAFMALMGDHMTKIDGPKAKGGDSAPTPAPAPTPQPRRLIEEIPEGSVAAPAASKGTSAVVPGGRAAVPAPRLTPPLAVTPGDIDRAAQFAGDEDVRRVLANPVLSAILGDPTIQRVLGECREDGTNIRKYLKDPVIAPKLRTLSEHGLISIVV